MSVVGRKGSRASEDLGTHLTSEGVGGDLLGHFTFPIHAGHVRGGLGDERPPGRWVHGTKTFPLGRVDLWVGECGHFGAHQLHGRHVSQHLSGPRMFDLARGLYERS